MATFSFKEGAEETVSDDLTAEECVAEFEDLSTVVVWNPEAIPEEYTQAFAAADDLPEWNEVRCGVRTEGDALPRCQEDERPGLRQTTGPS